MSTNSKNNLTPISVASVLPVLVKKRENITAANIKPGYVFYDIDYNLKIEEYEYFSLYPVKAKIDTGNYHIIINRTKEQPIRMHTANLDKVLKKNLLVYGDAVKAKLTELRERVKMIEEGKEY